MYNEQEIIELSQWINAPYVHSYAQNTLREQWAIEIPFLHSVLENFFVPSALQKIREACDKTFTERAHSTGLAQYAIWHWGAFAEKTVLRFFYGKTFRKFLNTLTGNNLTFKVTSYPQYNIFKAGSRGIPVHTDESKECVATVTLLQLSKGHTPGLGGELNFFEKDSCGEFKCARSIAPVENTLIVFNVGSKSFHSVTDMSGNWTRENIALDWYTK